MKVLIVGGSMAGLFAALLLTRSGFEVEVFERSTADMEDRGAGIVTHPELFAVLARAGIVIEPAALGVAVPGRRILDRSGKIIDQIELPQVLSSWGRLYAKLKAALPPEAIHSGATLDRVEETADAVIAVFADGRRVSGDLLIGADGLFSTVRRQFLPDVQPAYAGYVAWRGIVEEASLTQATRVAICDHFAFCLPPGEQMLGYPVSGAGEDVARGRRRFNFVWYRPAASEELRELLTDTRGKLHELSIPPNAIRPEVMAAMRDDSERLLAPAFAEVVRKTSEPFVQAILDLEVPTMVPNARVALIGDAAFVARPHIGAGVSKAAADADCLAQALANGGDRLDGALLRFDRTRQPQDTAIVARARELGAYMQAQVLSVRERELAEKHRQPRAVISETAIPFHPPDTDMSGDADRSSANEARL
jgi:2-polyprenyl-6-methoxyphenol hydroxylase-like FAD-dependent oxidoreductase